MKHSNFNAALCSHNLHQHCQELSLVWRNLFHVTVMEISTFFFLTYRDGKSESRPLRRVLRMKPGIHIENIAARSNKVQMCKV
jgi:hypothetical protein